MTTDQYARVSIIAQMLKDQGHSFEDYADNLVLFPDLALNREQLAVLRSLAPSRSRRNRDTGQQSLFAE